MEKIKKEKAFDSVKMMREIRKKINTETQSMSFIEFQEYIKKQLSANNSNRVGKL